MSEVNSIDSQVADLNDKLGKYQELSGKTWQDVMSKQGGKLGFALAAHLRGISPAKGQVRAEALARLRAGGGIKVRKSVEKAILIKYGARSIVATRQVVFGDKNRTFVKRQGKRLNLRALMVQREIAVRESGRGFLSVSARYPETLKSIQRAKSKFGPVLSTAGVRVLSTEAEARFTWDPGEGELATSAVAGLEKSKGRAAIALALRDTADDIQIYVVRKLEERRKEAGLK